MWRREAPFACYYWLKVIFGVLPPLWIWIIVTQIHKLTSCEWESVWLVLRESSSDDSSESSRQILVRLGMLLDIGLSSKGCRSLRSRLSMERLRTPQLKLSIVSPCNSNQRWNTKYSMIFSSTQTRTLHTDIYTTMQCRFREGAVCSLPSKLNSGAQCNKPFTPFTSPRHGYTSDINRL